MKIKIILLSFFLSLLLLGSCGQKKEKFADEISRVTDQPYSPDAVAAEESGQKSAGTVTEYEKSSEQNAPQVATEKIPQKIIKTADISFKVDKYGKARTKILDIIKIHKGYVSSENQTGDEYRTTNVMVIRVDAANFDALVENLLKEAVFVDYKRINAEDVTEEFVDINARLKSKKDAMLQYEIILKKAYTINDILEVQQYIRTLQEEIESLEGRLKYLSNKVELSTINLTFYEQGNILPAQSEGFGYKLKKALSWGWQGLVTFFLAIIYLWPLWLVGLITFFVIRYFVRKARKKRAARLQQQQNK
ncbi:MAG TPA: DUF4349 domain-containing protein [Bacteroidales bacterium]|jgi:hypothetical protein|nr:DUF4349 domain-containing protein [Bacteroidales bacterium]HNZ43112.1 DUF4349 domain-containing protein [Bacteroidales bacterium]HOH83209.1 DUF4349 domain-containing protein [Bacteroidales bacterium]HPB25930.1 DUF4349 domain-containing protein [Bacteroidales bacterium]HPI29131.1 DUF4349 domain-containing protein [Bacteroidales bacterium]